MTEIISISKDESIEIEIINGKMVLFCQYDELNNVFLTLTRENAITLIEKLAKVAEHLPK